ncbi:hypothetical protein ACFO4M_31945, partial [Pseudonocardia nematodicida]|uniref:hypothetical protein n=1 Tax=Pseudonocardia nematodicida TaxID=1206997 RepID=UPI00361E6529
CLFEPWDNHGRRCRRICSWVDFDFEGAVFPNRIVPVNFQVTRLFDQLFYPGSDSDESITIR